MKFQDYSNILITGASSSGKTMLLKQILLHNKDMFITTPNLILYLYKTWQPAYEELAAKLNNIKFIDELMTEEDLLNETEGFDHSIFIADDRMEEISKDSFYSELFTRLGHHYKISSFLLLQNNCLPSKNSSSINKNCHYTILTRSPRNMYTLRTLGQSMGDYKALMEAYTDATQNKNYSYLLVDSHPASDPKFKFRTQILPSEEECIVYISKKS